MADHRDQPLGAAWRSSTAILAGQRPLMGVQQDRQDCLIGPDGDLAACERGAEPDLLAADPQVP
jgi:hypothetical protein